MVPTNLRLAETHEWVSVEGDVCTVGITQFAVEQLTDVVFVELPKVGKSFKAKEIDSDLRVEQYLSVMADR